MSGEMSAQSGMKRQLEKMSVSLTNDNDILIVGDDDRDEGYETIIIPLAQVDIIIKWLQECRDEAHADIAASTSNRDTGE